MPRRSVAVLGAGIMGTSVSLFLARQGFDVSLVDRESAPVAATSRWNEGKIHLGYLYGADASLRTARQVLPGGLRFGPLLAELIESDLRAHTTTGDDTYLVHRDSVVNADSVRAQFEAVSELVRDHPDASSYLVDVRSARATALSPTELRRIASDDVVAGWRVPERSVNTRWIAERLAEAVEAANRVTFRPRTTVVHVAPVDSIHDRWRVRGSGGFDETFDFVVNALWNGRLPIDVTAGITPQGPWSHRYRLAVFLRTSEEIDVPSAIVAVGPFGDIKNYNGRDFYVSWYPAGLISEGTGLELTAPPPFSDGERERFVTAVRAGLESAMPAVGRVFDAADDLVLGGGFVFARGQGSIGDVTSTLHRRDRFGIQRRGSYFSVDTGKYSTAPWLAQMLSQEITS